jgi:hypothetical protein
MNISIHKLIIVRKIREPAPGGHIVPKKEILLTNHNGAMAPVPDSFASGLFANVFRDWNQNLHRDIEQNFIVH